MSGGLLDDVAALAKLAAASLDDVGAAAGRASVKAAGVVVDDTAVTPAYVHGLAADRELPIIKLIAKGPLKNKLLYIIPVALVLTEFVPVLVEIVLMIGGTYLCFEGAEKSTTASPIATTTTHTTTCRRARSARRRKSGLSLERSARTSILSGEIIVIALKDVLDRGFVSRVAQSPRPSAQRIGRGLVTGMPKLLAVLSGVGTAATVWVGGHILLVGADELGWHGPYDLVHRLENPLHDADGIGGVLAWLANTLASAIVGLAVGMLVVVLVNAIRQHRLAAADD